MDDFIKTLLEIGGWIIAALLGIVGFFVKNGREEDRQLLKELATRVKYLEQEYASRPERHEIKSMIEDAKKECYSRYDNFAELWDAFSQGLKEDFTNFKGDMKDSVKDIRQDIKQLYERRNGNGHGG
jgi:gas vesicle protein